MATEVLYPRDVLRDQLRVPHQRRRNIPANLNINRRPGGGATQRKTSPKPEKKKINEESGGVKKGFRGRKDDELVAGQVILLKRGESLDSLTTKIKSSGKPSPKSPPKQKPIDESTAVLAQSGSESPVSKPILSSPPPRFDVYAGSALSLSPSPRLDSYAGSAFSLSPSPESLPFPSFFSKKQQHDSRLVDSATRDLRRLLRLG